MSSKTPVILLLLAVATLLLTVLGGDSYSRLQSLQESVEYQKARNLRLQDDVGRLKHEVVQLHSDPRAIEKAARASLGVSRSNEIVVVFEKQSGKDGKDR